jgi:hypothetical protein
MYSFIAKSSTNSENSIRFILPLLDFQYSNFYVLHIRVLQWLILIYQNFVNIPWTEYMTSAIPFVHTFLNSLLLFTSDLQISLWIGIFFTAFHVYQLHVPEEAIFWNYSKKICFHLSYRFFQNHAGILWCPFQLGWAVSIFFLNTNLNLLITEREIILCSGLKQRNTPAKFLIFFYFYVLQCYY